MAQAAVLRFKRGIMSKFGIVLTLWFFCLAGGILLAAWINSKHEQRTDWEPGFIQTVREKVSHLYKKLRAKIKRKKS